MTTVIVDEVGSWAMTSPLAMVEATPGSVRRLVRICSPEALRRRFLLPVALDPETVLERYLRFLLAGPPEGAAMIAVVDDRPVGLLNLAVRGEAEVEASLLVAEAWQRCGVATALLRTELRRPRWASWTVWATVHPDNVPARRLVTRQNLNRWRVVHRDQTAWDFAVALPAAGKSTDQPAPR
jgi:GNAT superfamily N-acetyltransferase